MCYTSLDDLCVRQLRGRSCERKMCGSNESAKSMQPIISAMMQICAQSVSMGTKQPRFLSRLLLLRGRRMQEGNGASSDHCGSP